MNRKLIIELENKIVRKAMQDIQDVSLYFVQRKPSGYLGNAPIWWAEGGGYSAYLEKAKRFSHKEASDLLSEDPEKWAIYKCDEIEARCHAVFDMQDFKRLGISVQVDIGTGPYAALQSDAHTLAAVREATEPLVYTIEQLRLLFAADPSLNAGKIKWIDEQLAAHRAKMEGK